jgi:hypothetical protein
MEQTLHRWVEGELTLEAVDDHAENDITAVDDGLVAYQAFPEIMWFAHFGHELAKHHGASVGVDGLIETIECSYEIGFWGSTGVLRTGPSGML